jgi:hypothetical protein
MRDFKGMKRQRGRNRNGGGASASSGGGGKPQQNVNRAFDSNGPDNVKIRGHAQHVFEKYQQLARDSFSSGDRVLAENYLQHADHYFRVLRMLQPQRPAAEILGRDVFTSGLDIDFEDESEGFDDGGETAAESQESGSNGFNSSESRDPRPDRDRSDRDRQDRYENRTDRREDRFEGRDASRSEGRGDAARTDGRGDLPRSEGRGDAPRTQSFEPRRDNRRFEGRTDRPPRENPSREFQPREVQGRELQGRDNQGRDNQGRDNQARGEAQPRLDYRDDRPARVEDRNGEDRRYGVRNDGERVNSEAPSRETDRRDPLAVIEPESAPLMPTAFVEAEASPMLRSHDGGMSEAPAFLQSATGLDESGEARRPRTRRRRPKALDEGSGDDAAPAPAVEDA